jgi:putative phage-type endonuclease
MESSAITADDLAKIEEYAEVVVETIDGRIISGEDIDKLDDDDWLDLRTTGIGGSDAAATMGLSPWTTPYALWADKAERVRDDEDSDAMWFGRHLEVAIGEAFSLREGVPITRYRKMLRSRRWPWMIVNLDFLQKREDDLGVLEVKNVGQRQSEEWEGTAPDYYQIQVLHELAVVGPHAKFGDLYALVGGQNPRRVRVERDEGLIEAIAERERLFWELVQSHTPPAIDGHSSTTDALNAVYANPEKDSEIELDPMAVDILNVMAQIDAQIDGLDERREAYKNTIKAMLGNHEIGFVTLPGERSKTVVTWKHQHRAGYTVEPNDLRVTLNKLKPRKERKTKTNKEGLNG